MQYGGTYVEFTVKDAPIRHGLDFYIVLQGNGINNVYKMEQNNQLFSKQVYIVKPQAHYRYKYKFSDFNQSIIEEKGFRNLFYQKQNLKLDYWNCKQVILRIKTKQHTIMNTLQIIVVQKINSETPIKNFELELKQVMQDNQIYYEGIIFAESAMNLLDFQFLFNAVRNDTNKNEQTYIRKKTYYYTTLKTVGNQSIAEIFEEEFNQLSLKPQGKELSKSFQQNLQKCPGFVKTYFELSNDGVQNLLQIYETSLRYFLENLEIKDQQIKQLKLEKLEQEEIIFFNYQDAFQQDSISDYQSQFHQIVQDYEQLQNSFQNQISEGVEQNKSTIKNYKEKITNKEKSIESLVEKVKQLKNKNEENEQKIQNLEDQISKFSKILKAKKKKIDELEELLNKANQENEIITQEKDKFEQQIKELDVEIQEQKRTNEGLWKQNQITSLEKEKISDEKQAIHNQLFSTKIEIQNYQQNQRHNEDQLKNAKQLIGQYQDSSENEANLIKESRNILVKLIFKNLKDLKDIINFHKEPDIKADIDNLKYQMSQIELMLNNFVEEKTTLSQVEQHFQLQVQKQLEYLDSSDRIKQNEVTQINDTQNSLTQIFLVLKKFDKIKEIMLKPLANQILHRQKTNQVSIQKIVSPQSQRKLVKRLDTYR